MCSHVPLLQIALYKRHVITWADAHLTITSAGLPPLPAHVADLQNLILFKWNLICVAGIGIV